MTHPILQRMTSADPEERRAACLEARQDPAAVLFSEALAGMLGDPVKAVVRAASDALVEIGHSGDSGVKEALREALHSEEPTRRWGAAFTSARLAQPSLRLLPALVEALGCSDGDVRWAAARVIVDVGQGHGEVLPLLVGLVRGGENPVVRRMATYALRELAPDRPEAADVLLEAASDPDIQVRRAATIAMASLLHPPQQIARHLLRALASDSDAATRRLAALALGELGSGDPRSVPAEAREALTAASDRSEDPDLQRAVRKALQRLEAGRPH